MIANVQIVENYSEKAIAVIGETKAIKEQLKELGGRFNPRLTCGAGWIFSKKMIDRVKSLIDGEPMGHVELHKKVPKTNDLSLMDEYLKGIATYWGKDLKMMDYFKKKVSGIYKLSDNTLFSFSKPQIETSFCYSEGSTRTMDEAVNLCRTAEKDFDHFKNSNLRKLDELIRTIEDNNQDMYLYSTSYNDVDVNVTKFSMMTAWSAEENRFSFKNLREASNEDKAIILAALKNEREKFAKRIDTYLKRYGLSKINTWTYWADR